MIKKELFEKFGEQVSDFVKKSPVKDVDKNIKTLVSAGLDKMNLVTREEFDTQQKVLANTRKKLEELEKQVEKLLQK